MRYSAPLLSYPILTRALGTEGFAQFSLILASALVLSQFIEFGFGLMGVREIAQSSKEKSRIVSGEIVFGRIANLAIAASTYAFIVQLIPIEELQSWPAIIATVILATAYGMSSSWYYISIERAVTISIIETCAVVSTLALVVVFIATPQDALLACYLFALPLWLASIFGHIAALRDFGIRLPSLTDLITSFKRSYQFFILIAVTPIVNRIALLSLGAFSTPQEVAYYAAGDRLLTAAVNATVPLVRVLVPRISSLVTTAPDRARRLFFRSLIGIVLFFSLTAILVAAISPVAFPLFFGIGLAGAVPVFMAQMVILPASVSNRAIGMLGLVPMHREKVYQRMTLIIGIASLCFLPFAAAFGGGIWVALSRAFFEAVLAASCFVVLLRIGRRW